MTWKIGSVRACAVVCMRWRKRSSSRASPIIERRLRNTTDVLRRGLDSTLANWQLIAIRIAASILFVIIIVASIVAAIEHWPLILYILVVISVVLGVLI